MRTKKHPLYSVLANAKQRCYNPNNANYQYYGGLKITVCDEWLVDAEAFVCWALAHGWKLGLEIDRIDNSGPYSPSNCRFVTRRENVLNRGIGAVRRLDAFGEMKPITVWAEDPRCVVRVETLRQRIDVLGWDNESAIITPVGQRRKEQEQAEFV